MANMYSFHLSKDMWNSKCFMTTLVSLVLRHSKDQKKKKKAMKLKIIEARKWFPGYKHCSKIEEKGERQSSMQEFSLKSWNMS